STKFASPFSKVKVPRALRFIFLGLLIRRWRLWATAALILPEAVRLKRFFAQLLVFILGTFGPFPTSPVAAARHARWRRWRGQLPSLAHALRRGAVYTEAADGRQERRGATGGAARWLRRPRCGAAVRQKSGSALNRDLVGVRVDPHAHLLATPHDGGSEILAVLSEIAEIAVALGLEQVERMRDAHRAWAGVGALSGGRARWRIGGASRRRGSQRNAARGGEKRARERGGSQAVHVKPPVCRDVGRATAPASDIWPAHEPRLSAGLKLRQARPLISATSP